MLKKDILAKLSDFEDKVYKIWQEIIRLKNEINRDDEVAYDNEDTLVYDDFGEMMGAMVKHPYPIVSADNAPKRRIGFKCTITEKRWEIGLVAFLKTGGRYKETPDSIIPEVNKTSIMPPGPSMIPKSR